MPSLRAKADDGGCSRRGTCAGRDHLDQRHLVHRVEEVHADHPLGVRWCRARSRRSTATRCSRPAPASGSTCAPDSAKTLLLDVELLDHRLDDEVGPPRSRRARASAGGAPSCGAPPALGQPAALDLLVEELGGVRQAGGEGLGLDVLHPHRHARLVGDELGDAAAHDAGAEHRRGVDLARRAAGEPGGSFLASSMRRKTWTRFLHMRRGGELGRWRAPRRRSRPRGRARCRRAPPRWRAAAPGSGPWSAASVFLRAWSNSTLRPERVASRAASP